MLTFSQIDNAIITTSEALTGHEDLCGGTNNGVPLVPCAHPRAASADRFFSSKHKTINKEDQYTTMTSFCEDEVRYVHVNAPSNARLDDGKRY